MRRTPIPGSPSLKRIEAAVQVHFPRSLRIDSQEADVVLGRQIAWFLARRLSAASLPAIGRFFLNRHHTTVLWGVRVIEQRMASEPDFAEFVSTIQREIASSPEARIPLPARRDLADRIAERLLYRLQQMSFAAPPQPERLRNGSAGAVPEPGAGGVSIRDRGAA